MRWIALILVLLLVPIAEGYGVVFKSPQMNPQFGKVFESLDSGKMYTLDIKNDAMDVRSLSFTISQNATNAGLTVYTLLSKPASLPDLGDATYSYLSLDYIGFASFSVSSVSFSYRVPKVWLESNTVPRNQVGMSYLSKGGIWTEIPTKITDEYDDYVTYSSGGPVQARYFAIGKAGTSTVDVSTPVVEVSEELKGDAGPVDVVMESPVEKVNLAEKKVAPAKTQNVDTAVPVVADTGGEKTGSGSSLMIVFILVLILVVTVLGFVFWPGKGGVDRELSNYISESMKRGKTKEEVRDRLLEVGWHPDRIDKALYKNKKR
jgi:PGF-pre-PGF domain-containing protein